MKNLYALLVGINDYPIKSHKLNGCINDRNAMNDFFESYCAANDIQYHPLLLADTEATRKKIIDSFSHFEKAQNDDICIFYYSGHGSQMIAPKEFWRDETDQRCETIVCYDSRIDKGRDLSDKEISYLIWKATHQKSIHFLGIFDCCHAGTITRNVDIVNRMAEVNTTPVFAKRFEGVEHYKSHEGQLIPPESDHVVLSASRSYESSVELTLGGKRRGLFTYTLIDVLKKSELSRSSYSDLMSKIQTRVHNRIGSQHPQVDAQGKASTDQYFLNGALATNPSFVLKYREQKGWILELGKMHGIQTETQIQIGYDGDMQPVRIEKIEASQTIIHSEEWMKKEVEFYHVLEISGLNQKLKISFFPKLENTDAQKYIQNMVEDWNIEYIENLDEADYWMRINDRGYVLTLPNNERPVFKAIPEIEDGGSAGLSSAETLFLENVNKVALWKEVSELINPLSNGAAEKELKIDFYHVTDHIDYITIKPNGEKPMDINGDAIFDYRMENGAWENPNLRMSITNIGSRSLWIGALFLGEDFVVTDEFMPVKEIRPGEEAYPLTAVDNNGYRVSVIPIFVPDELHEWGETEVSNQIKVIASATPFSMEAFRQKGLELERKEKARGMGFSKPKPTVPKIPTQPSWFTKDIIYKIHRPLEGEKSDIGKTIQLHELTIEGHDSFSAETIRLSSSSNATRSTRPTIQNVFGSENFQPIRIEGNTRNIQHGLDTLELHNVQGQENVTSDNPLKLKLNIELENNERIFPFGFDPETNTYYPLGHPDDDKNAIKVEALPPEEVVGATRGFGKSLKIYLQKVVYQKIFKKEFHYPVLALAKVDEHQEVERETAHEVIKNKIQNPSTNRILIFIHGIIGDTSDQVKLVRRAVKNQDGGRQDLTNLYDVILTFDYESLNDSIETTAENLKKRFEQVGLVAGHGKTVHIIAHSMGGLVSRWFMEKLGGGALVDHFIQVGSPNLGSPWASTYHMSMFSLTKLINFLPIPSTINSVLAYIGKKRKKLEVTVTQLQPDSDFGKKLNSPEGSSNIPYTILGGDSSLIANRKIEGNIFKKMINRYAVDYRKRLMKLFFHDRSDDVVAVASIHGIPDGKCSQLNLMDSAGCNHFTYFNTDEGVTALAKILFELAEVENS